MPPDAMSANVVRLEELGHGATGSVYKAVHATTLQLLAVKEVRLHDTFKTLSYHGSALISSACTPSVAGTKVSCFYRLHMVRISIRN